MLALTTVKFLLAVSMGLLVTLTGLPAASAQDAPPLPEGPESGEDEDDRPAPGFESEDDEAEAEPPPRASKPPPSTYGRTPGPNEEAPPAPPVSPRDPSAAERLVELLADTTGEVGLYEVLGEVLADVMVKLDRLQDISPLAIRQVSVGSNLNPELAVRIRNELTALIHAGTQHKVVKCFACDATRTQVLEDQLVVTRGIISAEQMRAIGEGLGVRTFLDVRFGFDPEQGLLEMYFELYRVSDAAIVWSESFRADETTPMLMRATEAIQTREERLEDLRALLEGRPFFGWAATGGIMLIPFENPESGDIFAATAGLRLYERFGTDRRVLFGIDLMGVLNFTQLAGGLVSAGAWWVPFQPDLVNPELRVGGKAGAMILGNTGNTTVFQLGAEVLLRYRFGIYAYATYTLGATFSPNDGGTEGTLGDGLGTSIGLSFNW